MVRRYEAMFIVDADLDEDQIRKILDRYSKVITDGGGSISYAGKWEHGRRKLAYDIARRREGMYLITQFESDAAVPKELDRLFRISDEVFRHMIVRPDELVPPLTELVAPPTPEPAVRAAPAAEAAPAEEPDAEAAAEPETIAGETTVTETEAEAPSEPEAEPAGEAEAIEAEPAPEGAAPAEEPEAEPAAV